MYLYTVYLLAFIVAFGFYRDTYLIYANYLLYSLPENQIKTFKKNNTGFFYFNVLSSLVMVINFLIFYYDEILVR